jgi:hypothetical protein
MNKKQDGKELSKKVYKLSKTIFKLSGEFPTSPDGFATAKKLLKRSTSLIIHYEDMLDVDSEPWLESKRIKCYKYASHILNDLMLIKNSQLVVKNLDSLIVNSGEVKKILSKQAAVEHTV